MRIITGNDLLRIISGNYLLRIISGKDLAQAEIMTQKHATVFLCYVSHGSHMRCGIIDVIISYFQV